MASQEGPGLARQGRCRHDTAESEHGQASVLQFLQTHVLLLRRILGQELLPQEEIASIAVHLLLPSLEEEPQRVELKGANGTQEG
eukprot:Skav236492  [mRNA]  locus=scaffold1440:260625:261062:- [translate_table: standard]